MGMVGKWEWLEERILRLLREKPWLLNKLKEPNGVSWVVIEYWIKYEHMKITVPDFDKNPLNPESIARVVRRLGVSRTKILKEIEKQKELGLYLAR